jgi:hypothetical protein
MKRTGMDFVADTVDLQLMWDRRLSRLLTSTISGQRLGPGWPVADLGQPSPLSGPVCPAAV